MANQPQGLNGLNPLSYMGVNPSKPSNYQTYNRAPTANDSNNFLIGSWWLFPLGTNPPTARLFNLIALVGGQATWEEVTFDGANEFVTDNGTAIPEAGVLNVVGLDGVTTIGEGNTVTITTDGTVATEYVTDAGDAIPEDDVLQVRGGLNINTAGATNVVTINLDNSISLPDTTVSGLSGLYSLGGLSFMHDYGTRNTFLGKSAGNLTLNPTTSSSNTGIGYNCLNALTAAAARNVALGSTGLQSLTTGTDNISISGALTSLTTGSFNTAIGSLSGSSYTGAESSNILINNTGVLGEANTIRIGDEGSATGFQNSCYVAGIYPVAPGPVPGVVMVGNNGKLGTEFGTDGQVLIAATGSAPIWANITSLDASVTIANGFNSIDLSATGGGGGGVAAQPFFAYLPSIDLNVSGTGGMYRLGTNVALTTLYDVSGGFYPGNGSGSPATFTAPAAGYYAFNISLNFQWPSASTHSSAEIYFGPTSGAGGPAYLIYQGNIQNYAELTGPTHVGLIAGSVQVSMTMGQVIAFVLTVDGTTGDFSIIGSPPTVYVTNVSGYRIA